MPGESTATSPLACEVPTFHPTREEFQNLVSYIRKIGPVAEKAGICKICPPADWLPTCLVDEDFKFLATAQQLGQHKECERNFAEDEKSRNRAEKQFTVWSFGEMADDFKRNHFNLPVDMVDEKSVEKEFWNLMTLSGGGTKVYHGLDLGQCTGFPTTKSHRLVAEDMPYVSSDWNLNNVPELSVLEYLTANVPMKFPRCSVGMCFSFEPWRTEEYWSYSISYLHWGDRQTWYCVPGSAFEAIEPYVISKEEEWHSGNPVQKANQLTNRMISPGTLAANGIPVFHVNQEAGEFILTFPRSFVARISHGFNLTEKVCYCPENWLPVGQAFSRRQESLSGRCVFSFEELLFRILSNVDSLDTSMIAVLSDILSPTVARENEAIERLSAEGMTTRKREAFELLPIDNRRCHVCLRICFLSAVICQCNSKKLVCLRHVDDLCPCLPNQRRLHYRYTSAEMEVRLGRLQGRLRSYEEWVEKVNSALSAVDDINKLDLSEMKLMTAEAIQLYPQSKLTGRLQQVILEAEQYAAIARRSICNQVEQRSPNDDGKKLNVEEVERLHQSLRNVPVKMKETDLVSEILEKAIRFRLRMQEVMSGPIPDSTTLEELIRTSRLLSVQVSETVQLQQLKEQRKWMDSVDRELANPNQVTIELIGKLIGDGIGLHPHPSCEKMLSQLQHLLSLCNKLEEKAKHHLQTKPSSPLAAVESLLDEASKVPVQLPAVQELRSAVKNAYGWMASVENILNGQYSPYLVEVEKHLEMGQSVPVHLEKVTELESLIAKAKEWCDKTAKAFLKKNSMYYLYEVLCPRTDIGSSQNYKIRRKKVTDTRSGAAGSSPSVHWLLPDLDRDFPDPASVAASFKMAEYKEVQDMMSLRDVNLKKLAAAAAAGETGGHSSAKYCVCRHGRSSNMMQCELCKEIFHSSCVSLPKAFQSKSGKAALTSSSTSSSSTSSDFKFFCPMCMRSRRPRIETVITLLVDLGKFPVRLSEGEALQSLAEHAFAWQDRARRLLGTDELARALARLTQLNQRMAEHAAREKTEKIIRSELLKAAKHGQTKQTVQYGHGYPPFLPTSELLLLQQQEHLSSSDFDMVAALSLNCGQEVNTRTQSLGGMSFEHAYSSASKHGHGAAMHGQQHPPSSGSVSSPVLELSESTFSELEQLIIEGDLLEVSLDETNHLWKIMRACRPRSTDLHPLQHSVQVKSRPVEQGAAVETVGKGNRRKRKASHNMKVDDCGLEDNNNEDVKHEFKLKQRKLDKGRSGPAEKKQHKAAAAGGDKVGKVKQRRDRASEAGNRDSDGDEGSAGNNDDDCSVEKCLRPLGNAVKWVQCDGCELWYHYICLGLTKRDVSKHKEFLCHRCSQKKMHSTETTTDGPAGARQRPVQPASNSSTLTSDGDDDHLRRQQQQQSFRTGGDNLYEGASGTE